MTTMQKALLMKWEFYNEDENTKEIQKDEIEEFELVLKQQIQNLSEISGQCRC
mgnify:CR=1 FL=1